MKKSPKDGDRIRAVREARGLSQVKFAKFFGKTPPTVSRWEAGKATPPAQVFAVLAGLAGPPENRWFWRKAGVDIAKVSSFAEQVLKERGAEPPVSEIVRIPCSSGKLGEGDEAGLLIPLPAKFVPNRLSMKCLVFDRESSAQSFAAGDAVVLDTSFADLQDLSPIWGKVVLIWFPSVEARRASGFTEHSLYWPEGLVMGRLYYDEFRSKSDTISWTAKLWPFTDPGLSSTDSLHAIFLGHYDPGVNARELPREAIEKVRLEVPAKLRPEKDCQILGRVIGWFRPPKEGE